MGRECDVRTGTNACSKAATNRSHLIIYCLVAQAIQANYNVLLPSNDVSCCYDFISFFFSFSFSFLSVYHLSLSRFEFRSRD